LQKQNLFVANAQSQLNVSSLLLKQIKTLASGEATQKTSADKCVAPPLNKLAVSARCKSIAL
jgi:hypothetical protein